MGLDLRVTTRFEGAQVAQVVAWARAAGLASGRGDGVSTLAREATMRYGGFVARELQAAAKAPAAASSRRSGGGAARKGVEDVPSPPPRYRCPFDCDPTWRPDSSAARCPSCRSLAVCLGGGE